MKKSSAPLFDYTLTSFFIGSFSSLKLKWLFRYWEPLQAPFPRSSGETFPWKLSDEKPQTNVFPSPRSGSKQHLKKMTESGGINLKAILTRIAIYSVT